MLIRSSPAPPCRRRPGVSVSTLSRSQLLVNPTDLPCVDALRTWYQGEGQTTSVAAVGEGLASALKCVAPAFFLLCSSFCAANDCRLASQFG